MTMWNDDLTSVSKQREQKGGQGRRIGERTAGNPNPKKQTGGKADRRQSRQEAKQTGSKAAQIFQAKSLPSLCALWTNILFHIPCSWIFLKLWYRETLPQRNTLFQRCVISVLHFQANSREWISIWIITLVNADWNTPGLLFGCLRGRSGHWAGGGKCQDVANCHFLLCWQVWPRAVVS